MWLQKGAFEEKNLLTAPPCSVRHTPDLRK
jgi:hypothetical protein